MNKIPCEVIKDLLPLYIDGLTCDVTNEVIKEHLNECDSCKAAYESMCNPSEMAAEVSDSDKKEIDFLKKNRKRNKTILIGSLVLAASLIFGILFIRLYLIGNKVSVGAVNYRVEEQDPNMLVVEILPDGEKHSFRGTVFERVDGVTIELKESLPIGFNLLGGNDGSFLMPINIGDKTEYITLNGRTIS